MMSAGGVAKKLLAAICSIALAIALFPLEATQAFALYTNPNGTYFDVGAYTYSITSNSDYLGRFVQIYSCDQSQLGSSIVIPETVTDPDTGIEYNVVGVGSKAFNNLEGVKEIVLPDLSYTNYKGEAMVGQVQVGAFADCSDLEVLHFMGAFEFGNWDYRGKTVSPVKIIVHKGAEWDVSSTFEQSGGSAPTSDYAAYFAEGTTIYSSVEFKSGSTASEVFVKVCTVESSDGDDYASADTTPADLTKLTSSDVYIESGYCPNNTDSIPSAEAWACKYSDGTKVSVTEKILKPCAAQAVSASDLDYGQVVASEQYDYTGSVIDPKLTVYSANGDVLAADSYTVSYKNTDTGATFADGDLSAVGTYEVTVAGKGAYGGSCATTFSVARVSADWSRYCGDGAGQTSAAIANGASSVSANVDAATNNDCRVVVHADDYVSAVLAQSMAGLLNCQVLVVEGDEASAGVLSQLSSCDFAVVLGADAYITGSLEDSIGSAVDYARVATSEDTASAAVELMDFVKDVAAGEYGTVSIPDSYSGKLLVLPIDASASVFAALPWAYANDAMIVFASTDGSVSPEQLAQTGGATDVVVCGLTGTEALSIESQYPDAASSVWSPSSGEVESAISYAGELVAAGANAQVVALASSNGYGLLAASAAAAGVCNGLLYIDDGTDASAAALESAFSAEHAYDVSYGMVCAGYSDVSQLTVESIERITQEDDGCNLAFATVKVSAAKFVADGSAKTPTFTVTLGGSQLEEGVDYYLTYINNSTNSTMRAANVSGVGNYTVTLTGTKGPHRVGFDTEITGTYYGTSSIEFTIVKGSAPKITVSTKFTKKQGTTFKLNAKATKNAKLVYKVSSRPKGAKKNAVKVNAKGKVTIAKNAKKGTYKIKVSTKASSSLPAASKTVKLLVK